MSGMRVIAKQRSAFAVVCVVFLALLPAAGVATPRVTKSFALSDAHPSTAIVKFRRGANPSQRSRALRAAGATHLQDLAVSDWTLVAVSAPLRVALTALAKQPAVAFAEPNLLLRVQGSLPNDPCNNLSVDSRCPSTAWHLPAIAAPSGWDRYPGPGVYYSPSNPKSSIPAANRVKVAVIDAPVLRGSPDFRNGTSSDDLALGGQLDVEGIRNFPDGVGQEFGFHAYHGTYVSGLVAATANNAYASTGVGFNADVLPLPAVHGDTGAAEAQVVGDAIVYAHGRGSRVIVLALGLTTPSAYVNAAIQQVVASPNPPLVVAAAGNNTGDQPFYPAHFNNVMAIGGTDQADRKAQCANFGPKVSVAAPARRVQSLGFGSTMIAPDCGTSAATPQVAGLAALLFAQDPSRTPEQVRFVIEASADDLGEPGRDDFFGHGRINVDRALSFGQDLAQITQLSATPVRSGGGFSYVTARAYASQSISGAELFVGRPPAGGERGFPLSPADGSFNDLSEDLTGSFSTGSAQPGSIRIFVRAKDASGVWGPLASGAIYVDVIPPVISNLSAGDVVRPLDSHSTITFDISDDFSSRLSYTVQAIYALDSSIRPFRFDANAASPGKQSVEWSPQMLDLPGRYSIRVTLRDQAGNNVNVATSILLI